MDESADRSATVAPIHRSRSRRFWLGAQSLAGALRSFVRMYRPHEAREDTVLFPALRRDPSVARHPRAENVRSEGTIDTVASLPLLPERPQIDLEAPGRALLVRQVPHRVGD